MASNWTNLPVLTDTEFSNASIEFCIRKLFAYFDNESNKITLDHRILNQNNEDLVCYPDCQFCFGPRNFFTAFDFQNSTCLQGRRRSIRSWLL